MRQFFDIMPDKYMWYKDGSDMLWYKSSYFLTPFFSSQILCKDFINVCPTVFIKATI
jgi:hypothetical protein